jgi:Xaa-Pro aminopeptidase
LEEKMPEPLFDSNRVRSILNAADIDALITCRPENFSYISGVTRTLEHRFVREHTTYALLTQDARASLIVPFFEVPSVQEETWVEDLVPFRQFGGSSGTDDSRGGPCEVELAGKLSQLGLDRARIGWDERHTPVQVDRALREQLPHARFVEASDVFDRLRQVKTEEEIRRLAKSGAVIERAYRAMWESLEEGQTELDLASVAHKVFWSEGAPPLTFMVCGGGLRSSFEHLPPSDYIIQRGDLIRFDMGVRWQGYQSDIGRTFVCDQPSSEQSDIYAAMFEAYQAVIDAMKPGVTGRDIFDIYRQGMGDYYRVTPMEWVAHGYGLEVHEPPFLGPNMDQPLEPGMVFAVEIVLVFPDREGYHVEDPILITEDGHRRLIDLPNETLAVKNA